MDKFVATMKEIQKKTPLQIEATTLDDFNKMVEGMEEKESKILFDLFVQRVDECDAAKEERLSAKEEIHIRTEWEIFVAVIDRLLLLAENVASMVPEKQKDEFERGIQLFRNHLEAFQDQLTDVLSRCGIDYTCL